MENINAKDNIDDNKDYDKIYIDNIFRNKPITLTSHVNMFSTLFGTSKENNFSLLDYINSVVILDEIQAYNNNIWNHIFKMLFTYSKLLNIKFIIMSATLPDFSYINIDTDIVITKLLSNTDKYYKSKLFKDRVKLDFSMLENASLNSSYDVLQDLKSKIFNNLDKKVIVEFISKRDARLFFDEIKNSDKIVSNNIPVYEITGDDNNYERKKVLNTIKSSNLPCIVICTQTIEAGTDIDMDIGFKDISFIDSEEQFLGRINRSAKKDNAIVYFFNYTDSKKIYKADMRIGFDLFKNDIKEALINKDFNSYFLKVMEKVVKESNKNNNLNIEAFLKNVGLLNYSKVKEDLTLIKNNNSRQIFLNYDYQFEDGEVVSGKDIWNEYKMILNDNSLSYTKKQVLLSNIKSKMNIFMYNVNIYNDSMYICDEEITNILYIENGEEYIKDNKFDSIKFYESLNGIII